MNRGSHCIALLASGVALAGLLTARPLPASAGEKPDLGDTILLCWNDLGMHCMNQTHAVFSVLPPYNNLYAQAIRRGDATRLPEIVVAGLTVEYSIPGNTYSVGKTDFWDWDLELFGVDLPPDIGLTGKGLSGELDPTGSRFQADGIPITPFPDATPTIEDPYQQAAVVLRTVSGDSLAVSRPVVPVSTEIRCVSAGCHGSEHAVLQRHELVAGFDPNDTPILCASCHASPALGTQGIPEAGYFSEAIHKAHTFLDEDVPGIEGCYQCHPGVHARCLRGTMGTDYGMICQDCHGDMEQMAQSIDDGRVPWLEEPSCRGCHTAQYGEPEGQLYRLSEGHGGIMCSGCHNSPHAIYPSSLERENANVVALQGTAGTLRDCTVCHGVIPAGSGPHGMDPSGLADPGALESEIVDGAEAILVAPNPTSAKARFQVPSGPGGPGRLVVVDVSGRTLSVYRPRVQADGSLLVEWDGAGRGGEAVGPGVYFVRWENGARRAGAKVVVH